MSNSLACKHAPEVNHAQLYDILVSELSEFVVFLMDRDGCIVSWNPGVERILGYSESEWLGQSADIIFTPEDRARGKLQQELSYAARQGESVELRWHLRRDGTRIFVKESFVALRDRSGALLGFSKVMHDLTDRERREAQLQDALAYTEGIVDTLREPLLVLDRSLRIRLANRAFCRTFQLSKEETEGVALYRLGNGDWDMPQLRILLEEVLRKQVSTEDYEVEQTFPGLGHKVMLLNARNLFHAGDQTELLLLAIEDVTKRKRAEKALYESEKQRRLMMDAAPAIISYVGRDLRYRLANSAYERWFGKAPSELIGSPIGDLFGPDLLATVKPRIEKVLAGEMVSFEEDYPDLNGGRTLQVTYTPDLDEQGRVQGFVVLGSDVTTRKKAEIALRESEERWRGLFEGMIEGFFLAEMIYDEAGEAVDFRFLQTNPAFQTLTGLVDASGQTMRELIPDIPSELIERYAQVVRTGEPAHFEIGIPAQKNTWYEVRARPTEPRCFAVLFLNITERKANEALLRENEGRQAALVTLGDRLRDLREIPSLTLAAMEIAGTFLRVARAGYGTVDSSQQYVTIESDWTNGQVPTLAGTYRFSDFGEDLGGSLRRGESFVVPDVTSHPITARDSARWKALNIGAVINLPLVENGRLVALLFIQHSTPRDWTESDLSFIRKVADRTWAAAERARALSELQESEEFTRSVLASSPDCVKVIDLDGRLLTINDGGCEQMEIDDLTLFVNRPWSDFWEESREPAETALTRAKEGQTYRFESFRATPKGTPKWWEVVVTPIRNSAGNPVRILSLARDITDRKHADQERERLTLELKRSNEELSQFAHTVAHDLQSPLRGVTGFAQLLQRNAKHRLLEKDVEFLDHIIVSARRMADLVGGLLQFAQVGQGEIERKPIAMDLVLNAVIESLQLQIEEQGATVERTPLPLVAGDPVQLLQLLQNLVGNALKYRSADVPPVISISASQEGQYYVFSIRDNGEGIAPEHLTQIFEPLKRLHGTDVPGTGLGLAVCQRIVNRHGGKIWVESQPDAGSTFFFTLPVQ